MSLEQRLADSAGFLDAEIDTYLARASGRRRPRRSWRRPLSVAAAAVIAVAGLIGVILVRSGTGAPVSEGVESTPSAVVSSSVPADPTKGRLLSTPVPADVQPLVSMDEAGWTVDGMAGFVPLTVKPSPDCPGCGATRLVLVADGSPLSGAVFTAWTVDGDVDLARFDAPVTVGAIGGRATSSPTGTAIEKNRMTLAWPVAGARTAFVDARGLTSEQIVQMAASLTFESTVPVMPARPAGFHEIEAPAPGGTVETYLNMSDGRSVLEVYATNAGVHGLVDWSSIGNVLRWEWEPPRVVDGVTVAFDAPAADERPILAATAAWVAGGWGYVVIGHVFDSEEDFFAAVSSLQLTDPVTFASTTARTATSTMPTVRSTTGWDGVVQSEP